MSEIKTGVGKKDMAELVREAKSGQNESPNFEVSIRVAEKAVENINDSAGQDVCALLSDDGKLEAFAIFPNGAV